MISESVDDIKLVIGDFLAKIWRDPQNIPIFWGRNLDETTIDKKVRCITSAVAKELVVNSTLFLHKKIHNDVLGCGYIGSLISRSDVVRALEHSEPVDQHWEVLQTDRDSCS